MPPPDAPDLTFEEFQRVDIRVGTILSAVPLAGARHPAYKLEIDFGPDLGTRWSSAQVTDLYEPETLNGRQVAAVVNFSPKRVEEFQRVDIRVGTILSAVPLAGARHPAYKLEIVRPGPRHPLVVGAGHRPVRAGDPERAPSGGGGELLPQARRRVRIAGSGSRFSRWRRPGRAGHARTPRPQRRPFVLISSTGQDSWSSAAERQPPLDPRHCQALHYMM